MRISTEWLQEWVDLELTPEALAEELTTAGLEVDSVTVATPPAATIVVAEILEVQPHPNADRLVLCRVSDGADTRTIVCGAPNVAVGIKVPYAPIGSTLPGGLKIKRAKIRGVSSEGMLCSARELELSDDADGLLLLAPDAPVGVALVEHLKLNDAVLDVDLTPNRGDCFSVLGIAREVAARRGASLNGPGLEPVGPQTATVFPVELVATAACPRFAGRVITGLDASAESPDWLKERLRRVGLRSIHPVVDVTNYVMLELGQPLHAYSLEKLRGGIRVRFASTGEKLKLLDGADAELQPDVLVIADESGPIGLAGIMGGASTAVDASTTDIFFEAAFFSPSALRGRARRFGLHTDASVRFERGVDPLQQERAIERATSLLKQIAGGAPGPTTMVEHRDAVPSVAQIRLRKARVEKLLGLSVTPESIEASLRSLGMKLEAAEEGVWFVTAPSFRFDIAIEEDLIEEIGRMIGYDEIETVAGSASIRLGTVSEQHIPNDDIADLLVDRGYHEVITYSFIDEPTQLSVLPGIESVRLANPISSDLSVLRGSLWPGVLRAAQQNLSRQQARCRFFELGTEFAAADGKVIEQGVVAGLVVGPLWPEHWDLGKQDADFFDVKADVEALLALTRRLADFDIERAEHPALNPAQSAKISCNGQLVGWLGAIHPRLQRVFDLKKSAVLFSLNLEPTFAAAVPIFESYSKFPSVRRDLALLVDEAVSVGDLIKLVEKTVGETLSRVVVFDIYRGEGIDSRRKSVGLGLILQDASRTLTDVDADGLVETVTRNLERELGATIRT